jgi:uncharacterized protein YjiK
LKEISGLSIAEDGKTLFAIQDEAGFVYQLDKNSGTLLQTIAFGKSGDFEDIQYVNGILYILKSSGSLYQLENLGKPNQKVTMFNSFMTSENDAEGLVHDVLNNRLLIACKGWGVGEDKNQKSVFAFDLTTLTFSEKPILTITKKQFIDYLAAHPELQKWDKLVELSQSATLNIGPSGIAIHPKSKEFYVISARGNMLIVLSPAGELVQVKKLSKKIHEQPEGICFDTNGDLWISNEVGETDAAKIYRFKSTW